MHLSGTVLHKFALKSFCRVESQPIYYADATECGYEVDENGKFVLQTCIKLLYQLKDKEKIPSLKQDIEKARKLLEEIKNS